MFCTKCGAALEDGAKFCTKCGSPIAVEPIVEPVAEPPVIVEEEVVTQLYAEPVAEEAAPQAPVYEAPYSSAPQAPVYEAPYSSAPQAPVYEVPSYNNAPQAPVYEEPPQGESKLGRVFSLISMLCGIASMVFCWIPAFFMLTPSIAAIALGIVGLIKKGSKGKCITGIILGGIAFFLIIIISTIWAVTLETNYYY